MCLQVDLAALYEGLLPGQHVYRLCSVAARSGGCWVAFARLPEVQAWAVFDGAHARRVGAWGDVWRECEGRRIQPCLLLYESGQQ